MEFFISSAFNPFSQASHVAPDSSSLAPCTTISNLEIIDFFRIQRSTELDELDPESRMKQMKSLATAWMTTGLPSATISLILEHGGMRVNKIDVQLVLLVFDHEDNGNLPTKKKISVFQESRSALGLGSRNSGFPVCRASITSDTLGDRKHEQRKHLRSKS